MDVKSSERSIPRPTLSLVKSFLEKWKAVCELKGNGKVINLLSEDAKNQISDLDDDNMMQVMNFFVDVVQQGQLADFFHTVEDARDWVNLSNTFFPRSMIPVLVNQGLEDKKDLSYQKLWNSLPLAVKTNIQYNVASFYASLAAESPFDTSSASRWDDLFNQAHVCALTLIENYLADSKIAPLSTDDVELQCFLAVAAVRIVVSVYGLDESCRVTPGSSFWFEPISKFVPNTSLSVKKMLAIISDLIVKMLNLKPPECLTLKPIQSPVPGPRRTARKSVRRKPY